MESAADNLRRMLHPKSVVFVGASLDTSKWGHILLANAINGGFGGRIYPINPHAESILGLDVCRSIEDLPEDPDLVVIATPPGSLVDLVASCTKRSAAGCLIVTAGLAESGDNGQSIEREIAKVAAEGSMTIIGPNCNGVMTPDSKLYCTLAALRPSEGPFGVVAQSGNIAQSITLGVMQYGFGVSHYISSGNELMQGSPDFFEYLGDAENTRVILAYVEGVRDGRRFFEVAKRVASKKPIVLLKGGTTTAGAEAAQSHTAMLAASDTIFDAVCRQSGILRVDSLEKMIDVGVALATEPLPRGNRVAILTAAGGYGVLAADICESNGVSLAKLSEPTLDRLDEFLPDRWPRRNPVDKSGLVGRGTDRAMVEAIVSSDDVDGLMVLGVPIGTLGAGIETRLLEFEEFLGHVAQLINQYHKPILVLPTWSLLLPEHQAPLVEIVERTGLATFKSVAGIAWAYVSLTKFAAQFKPHSSTMSR